MKNSIVFSILLCLLIFTSCDDSEEKKKALEKEEMELKMTIDSLETVSYEIEDLNAEITERTNEIDSILNSIEENK